MFLATSQSECHFSSGQAEYWSSQEGFLEQKPAKVDTFCRFNYAIVGLLTVLQRGAQSTSAQNKMLSGIGGFVLGLLFLGLGLFIYFRNQKGKEPGGVQDPIAFQGRSTLCSRDVTELVISGFNQL
ncbi:H-2 class II histocompatibility antigen, I-A beta chain [Cricetulus griseus]|uniref:H-2 class II histocompatibility antigen, I-A beta chain n=1 Tax=Cricetulus griseus TaxID=10029 RepID=G3II66_CRIGR|nr:H-2 class II histocompatibility antigen, I-A beta chain [Cricetulus griseus]